MGGQEPRLNLGRELALDLGSSNLVLSFERKKRLVRRANRLRIEAPPPAPPGKGRRGRRGEAQGEALPPRIVAPVRHGRVRDPEALDSVLEMTIRQARQGHWPSWHLGGITGLVAPPVLDEEERLRLEDLVHRQGLSPTRLVDLSRALAHGCGLDTTPPRGRMVIDIGGDKAFLAVYSLGGVVASEWVDMGGEALDTALASYVARRYNVHLAPAEAERVKIEAGAIYPQDRPLRIEAVGTKPGSDLPQAVTLEDGEVRDAFADGLEPLVLAIQRGFKRVPPEMASDIAHDGLVLAGGGAMLRGLPQYLHERIGVAVKVTPDPINAVIRGVHGILRMERGAAKGFGSLFGGG